MRKQIVACMAVALAAGSTGAVAGSTNYWFAPFLTQLSDNSAEYLINNDPTATDTLLEKDDRLRGIFSIDTTENLQGGGGQVNLQANGFDQLSGIFEIQVDSVVQDLAGNYNYVFKPSAAFEGTYGAGAMVAFYTDPDYDFTRLGPDIPTLEANVTDGSLFMVAGFDGGNNEVWTAVAGTNDISTVGAIPAPNNGGGFNIGLDLLVNNTGQIFDPVGCLKGGGLTLVDMCGSGSLLGTQGAATPYDSFDDVNFVMRAIPEPSLALLIGSGLLVGSAVARRRKRS